MRELLARLAVGEPCAWSDLARDLGTPFEELRAAAEALRALGVALETSPEAVRLTSPVELIDAEHVRAAMSPEHAARLERLEVLLEVDSTSTRLLGRGPPPPGRAEACLAERQTAGRGRQGRPWVTPFGCAIALSVGWRFEAATHARAGLSLATGVAIVRALERAGARGVQLKWPNDVWFHDRKLAGVLVELQGEASGTLHVVIGVGLNVALSADIRRALEASGVRAAAAADACPSVPSRNRLAGTLIDELAGMLLEFEREGFAPFRPAWSALDALKDRPARLVSGEHSLVGRARGVDEDGALLLESGARTHRVVSGEVSLRLAEGGA